GTINLRTGGTIHFEGAVASQTVNFNPPGGTAVIDHPEQFLATFTGFAARDTIDLDSFVAVSDTFANNALVLSNAIGNQVTLGIQGTFTSGNFTLTPDSGGGTNIKLKSARNDFNGDGTSDILLRNSTSG